MQRFSKGSWSSLIAALLVAGCSSQPGGEPNAKSDPAPVNSAYLLQAEPLNAKPVIAAREAARDRDEVVVVGRIGGRSEPWTDGMAIFPIVDPSLKACSDIEGDTCEKPWDYCCETARLPTATALVKVVDEAGNPLAEDARKLLGVKELDTVVVQGKAQRDDAGNFTILASGIYVRK